MRRCGTVVKNMAEMRLAFRAGNRGAHHAKSSIAGLGHVLIGDGLPETRPSGARFELCGGIKQRVVATYAAVQAFLVKIPILARKSDFRVSIARDVVSVRGKLLAPFVRRFDHFRDA